MNLRAIAEDIDFRYPPFTVSEEAKILGLHGCCLLIKGMSNYSDHPSVSSFVNYVVQETLNTVDRNFLKTDKIILGYRELHTGIGKSNKKFMASAENLIRYVLKKKTLPQINTIVDLYNAISVKYKLAMGGHDLDKINGTVTLRMSNGNETYSALGSKAPIMLPAGEYGYFDNESETLCRMDVKQSKKSLIDLSTNDTLIIFQGNRATSKSYIDHAVSEFLALARAHLHAFNVQKINF